MEELEGIAIAILCATWSLITVVIAVADQDVFFRAALKRPGVGEYGT